MSCRMCHRLPNSLRREPYEEPATAPCGSLQSLTVQKHRRLMKVNYDGQVPLSVRLPIHVVSSRRFHFFVLCINGYMYNDSVSTDPLMHLLVLDKMSFLPKRFAADFAAKRFLTCMCS